MKILYRLVEIQNKSWNDSLTSAYFIDYWLVVINSDVSCKSVSVLFIWSSFIVLMWLGKAPIGVPSFGRALNKMRRFPPRAPLIVLFKAVSRIPNLSFIGRHYDNYIKGRPLPILRLSNLFCCYGKAFASWILSSSFTKIAPILYVTLLFHKVVRH